MECGRFFYFDIISNSCRHLQFNQINLYTILGVFLIPAAVGLCQAASLGPIGFQIFVLLLVFNYGKTDASFMTQPMQLGLYCLQAYRNLKKRKLPDQPQVNENLVLLLAPMMISGAAVGLHSKDYIPSLLQMVIQIVSLLLLIITTRKKAKQIKSIAIAATQEQINDFEKDFINVGDGILIDMELFFSQIQSVKGRESMIKILPKEILDMDLTIDEHKMKAKDFLNSNQHIGQQIHKHIKVRSLPKFKVFLFFLTMVVNIALLYKQPEMHICDQNAFRNFLVQFWHRNQTQTFVNLAIFLMTAVITKTFNFILLAQLLVLSYIFGLLLGSVGAAAQIAVILLLKNLKGVSLTTQEIQMTVPFLMFSVTLTSTVISLATGLFHDIVGVILIFFLAIFGQKYFYPIFASKIKPLFALKIAQIFQVVMLVAFVGQQFQKNMHKDFKSLLVPRKVCN